MGERMGNLSRRESMSTGSGDGTTARRRFRAGLLKWCLGILIAMPLGLVVGIGVGDVDVVAATAGPAGAAGPCGEKTMRYADCGNGTVTDTMTGLIWLKQSSCLDSMNWEAAKKAVANLKNGDCMLADGSAPGDWRLPTKAEWEETMKNAKELACTGPDAPTVTNDAGTKCMKAGPTLKAKKQMAR